MPNTWKDYSKIVLGRVVPFTEGNERYVATHMIQRWIDQGMSDAFIARKWNGGDGKEKKGINSQGVPYDTVAYAQAVLSYINH